MAETKTTKTTATKAATKTTAAKKTTTTKTATTKATTAKTTKAAAPKAEVKDETKAVKAETKPVKQIKVTLVRSTIGFNKKQALVVKSLGLGKLNSSNVLPDNQAVRGMIFKVKHLVNVEEI